MLYGVLSSHGGSNYGLHDNSVKCTFSCTLSGGGGGVLEKHTLCVLVKMRKLWTIPKAVVINTL